MSDEELGSEFTDASEEVLANYNHQCYICDKTFSANSNLNRHLRKIHKENVQSPYNNVKCALCDSVYSSSQIYNDHLGNDHKVKIEVERLTFHNQQQFEEWKHIVESETTSQFIKSRGQKKTKNVNKTYYSCNRSGYYVSKARTRKALKKQGSRKINGRCPASMNVTVLPDSTYDVRFVKTHVGHNFELKHLDLSDKDRDMIVQKLSSGITKKDIIKQLRSTAIEQLNSTASISPTSTISASGQITNVITDNSMGDHETTTTECNEIVVISNAATSSVEQSDQSIVSTSATNINSTSNSSLSDSHPTSRLHLATTKDIHNIINSKHLNSKRIRLNYDLNNVDAWINEMKEYNENSTVLFSKSQAELSARFPKLREDDFVLIVMKDGQAEILKKYADKCIIIDSTHNVHCECLHVALIAVVEDTGRGFPVAFLFSTRTHLDVLEVFFTVIKEKVGALSSRMLIADELDDFYIAWTKTMTRPTHNLLTPWSVFDSWAKKFKLIGNREKLRKMRKSLKLLLNESETDKFSRSLAQIVEDNRDDPDVSEFTAFFETKFAKNPDLWSSCLRKAQGVSNFELWRVHERFKIVYKEGKTSKKLCKFIASLMSLFDANQLKQLIAIEEKNPAKQRALLDRHKKSIEIGQCVYELAVEPVYWLCPSESSNEYYYEVRQDAIKPETNCCDLKCSNCGTCRHGYKCSCLDYVVNLNMCKHIHQICTMCK